MVVAIDTVAAKGGVDIATVEEKVTKSAFSYLLRGPIIRLGKGWVWPSSSSLSPS